MRVYDPEADQLKCNFCTQWFPCQLVFANQQRYSLNACPKCLANFHFSLVHPHTQRVYRLLLIDAGFALNSPAHTPQHPTELVHLGDDLRGRVADAVQAKIEKMLVDMRKMYLKVEAECEKLRSACELQRNQQAGDLNSGDVSVEMRRRMEELRGRGVEEWLEDSGCKARGKLVEVTASRRKNSCDWDKENLNPNNRFNCARSIKTKILGLPTHNTKLRTSSSKESRLLSSSQSKSIVKSIKLGDEVRRLEESVFWQSPNWQEQERAEISRLMGEKVGFDSYLPREVTKEEQKYDSSRNVVESILEMRARTARSKDLVELIGGNAARINFDCYLRSLGNVGEVRTIRMIRSQLVDADFDHLLRFLSQHPSVEALIVTNNKLTEISLQALQNFKARHPESKLTHAYFGNNFMKPQKMAAKRESHRLGLEIYT